MNNKDQVKLVYKPVGDSGIYQRYTGNMYVSLGIEFPGLSVVFSGFEGLKASKVEFDLNNNIGVAWRDKHGNVIVRYVSKYKQSKIDFDDVSSKI